MEKLLNEFVVHRPIDQTWHVLTDVERIARRDPHLLVLAHGGSPFGKRLEGPQARVTPCVSLAPKGRFSADSARTRRRADRGRDPPHTMRRVCTSRETDLCNRPPHAAVGRADRTRTRLAPWPPNG